MSFARSLAILTVLTIAAVDSAWSQSHGQNQTGLTVVNPWSRATAPSQKAGGVFLTIENASDQPDRLIGVESEMSEEASLHTMIRDGDVMRMRPVEGGIEVPANGYLSNSSTGPGWKCERGYRATTNSCIAIQVPANGYLAESTNGHGWRCNRGFRAFGDRCVELQPPKNAHLDRSGNDWNCNLPYRRDRNRCLLREET